jgi:hypothetical protein
MLRSRLKTVRFSPWKRATFWLLATAMWSKAISPSMSDEMSDKSCDRDYAWRCRLFVNEHIICLFGSGSIRSGGQTLHQGDSVSHNRDASARQNLFACWKAVFDKIRFLLCDVFTVLRLGHQTVSLILFRKEASSGLAKSWIHSTVSCSAKGLSCASDTAFWASYEVWMQTWI